MNFKNLAVACALAVSLASCSSSKTVLPYFNDIPTGSGDFGQADYMPHIRPADELFITVNSKTPGATAAYNLPYTNPSTPNEYASAITPRQQVYTVDSKGDIDFPVLGTIHVDGMTTEQLRDYLIKRISPNVKDPRVTVDLVNFNVIIGGEVSTPTTIKVDGNRITILEALAQAGDLTEYGERSNVLVIREENGKRTYGHIDLNKSDLFNSPYYYLQQNDYVYVSPNSIRQANSKYNQNNAFKLSVISTIVSATSVIASLVIALTVK